MPSPTCQIPVTIRPSEWFTAVEGDESFAYLPSSIPPGGSATLEGAIKVFISNDVHPPPPGNALLEQSQVSIVATMPWVNKRLEHFEFSRTIDIQYPLELRN